ncbi:sepiapterin reductase [Asbolus verrucosus]|uniref:Sepiapterin reductase n=1 Tax=Asbolus verrucosus TaxID=1661398 RepID=A0A482WF51_ASBVE|nr:sepiapterin reductase [Asbolus verrucosus]
MTMMDPWGVSHIEQETDNTVDAEEKRPSGLKFEDNFTPTVRDTLPDSEQYLAILEKKLRDIKNDPNVLRQLTEKKEACMQNLLNSEFQFEEADGLDSPLGQSQLLRTILPQKQALIKGEIVGLIDYDHLDSSESEKESDQSTEGIGRAIALEISRNLNQNSIIILLARSESGLEQTKNLIQEVDKSLTVITHDVDLARADRKTYEKIFDEVTTSVDTSGIEFGIIFHNAGSIGDVKQTLDLSDVRLWRDYFDLNLFSVAALNAVFLQKLRPIAPQLVVVNITSLCGRTPFKNLAMYGSGKAARELFFKVLAVEEPNIIVFNYSPGPVDTDMFNNIIENAQSAEVQDSFKKVKETSILTTEQTVGKLIAILEKGDFKSGDTVDYYDRI